MIYDGTKYKIYKYGGVWYSCCPHCPAVQRGRYWWQALEHMRIHAYEHPVDKGRRLPSNYRGTYP